MNGISFRNTTNAEATSVLRNTGTHVQMKISRKDSGDPVILREVTTQPQANGKLGHVPKEVIQKQESSSSENGSGLNFEQFLILYN